MTPLSEKGLPLPSALCRGRCCTRIEQLSVSLGGVSILEDINLHIHCREFTALVGPNGAGKSTLLKAMLGQMPYTGKMNYMDENFTNEVKPIIGYVPQTLAFDTGTPVSVSDLFQGALSKRPVWLGANRKNRERTLEALSVVGAEALLNRRVGALSGGELQRILLALALIPSPDLLFLDEPISGVDQNGTARFYETVSDLRKVYDLSIILVSHDFDLVARHADRAVLLNRRMLASRTPEAVFSSTDFKTLFPGYSTLLSPAKEDQ